MRKRRERRSVGAGLMHVFALLSFFVNRNSKARVSFVNMSAHSV